jgi:hypothetical protein
MSIIINRPVEERHSFLYAKQRVKLFYNLEHLQSTCGNPLATMAMRLSISSCLIFSLQNINGVGVCLCCSILEAPWGIINYKKASRDFVGSSKSGSNSLRGKKY